MKWELLLIDDEPCILETLAELLTEEDINVTKARNGEEGLELLRTREFDVVVSDVKMPRKNGQAMLEEARAEGIFVPMIFFSAHSDTNLTIELKRSGATAVIQKPYFERLSAELNSVLVKKEFLLLPKEISQTISSEIA